ncbi:MAG: Uma2 family endonuclease [Thermomicrobiales bacterium]
MAAQPAAHPQPDRNTASVGEQHVVMRNVSWKLLTHIPANDEERRVPRIAFDDGDLEFTSPSRWHEVVSLSLAQLIVHVACDRGMDVIQTGPTTITRPERRVAFEPDCGFFIQHAPAARRDDRSIFPEGFPPDLVIEVEITPALVDRLPILSALSVPEIWRATGTAVTMLALAADGLYAPVETSLALPGLTSAKVTEFMALH